jgi:uncharacterized protein with HEPN domain
VKTLKPPLQDLLATLDAVAEFTEEGREYFWADQKTQFAVIFAYEEVGRITKRLPQTLRIAHPQIDWQELIALEEFLAVNYEPFILDKVWTAVENLPNLRAAVEALLASLPPEQDA